MNHDDNSSTTIFWIAGLNFFQTKMRPILLDVEFNAKSNRAGRCLCNLILQCCHKFSSHNFNYQLLNYNEFVVDTN